LDSTPPQSRLSCWETD